MLKCFDVLDEPNVQDPTSKGRRSPSKRHKNRKGGNFTEQQGDWDVEKLSRDLVGTECYITSKQSVPSSIHL
jgi:hypothetical protein